MKFFRGGAIGIFIRCNWPKLRYKVGRQVVREIQGSQDR